MSPIRARSRDRAAGGGQADGRSRVSEGAEHARIAGAILSRVFRDVPFGFAARLWDGTTVALGEGLRSFTLVFRSPGTFRSLMLRPNTRHYAEAFVNGDLEVEGDLFEALRLANRIDALRLGFAERLSILYRLLRL